MEDQTVECVSRWFLPTSSSLILMLTMLTAPSPAPAAPNPSRFGDVFPIMGWVGPPGHEQTLERYREMAAAGLTVSLHHPLKKLALAKQAGLLAIVSDGRIRQALGTDDKDTIRRVLDEVVAECKGHPEVVGFGLRDEPSAGYFPNLARVSTHLAQRVPGCFPYINLFPNYASAKQLGTETYEAHVRQFISVVQPPVVSYDHYPCVARTWRSNYYENLEIVRRCTLDKGLPFWAFALVTPHGSYRDPTEAEIRLQVNSNLVYGATGLAYFCYWTPGPSRTWDWDSAIIRRDGARTEHFGQVKRVNARVQALGKVLLKCTSTNVYHTKPLPLATSPLPADSPIRCTKADLPLVFGFFTHSDGAEYVMILNRDYAHNVRSSLQLVGIQRLDEVAPLDWIWTGDGKPDEKGVLPFRLYAGDARLFKIIR